ncbi:MAG: hypothetical protein FWD35_01840 [Oscillospiraceae bacterium]|nr:hypothetical protein [Oscillospiraceae bacterium]
MKQLLHLIISAIIFLLFYAVTLGAVVLISTGILAIPISVGVMSGFFTSVASDLSPPAMFFAGISCLSGGVALGIGIVVLFPKQSRVFKSKDV